MRQPPWRIVRHWAHPPDAQRRWDRAFQLLLDTPRPAEPDLDGGGGEATLQESPHANPRR